MSTIRKRGRPPKQTISYEEGARRIMEALNEGEIQQQEGDLQENIQVQLNGVQEELAGAPAEEMGTESGQMDGYGQIIAEMMNAARNLANVARAQAVTLRRTQDKLDRIRKLLEEDWP